MRNVDGPCSVQSTRSISILFDTEGYTIYMSRHQVEASSRPVQSQMARTHNSSFAPFFAIDVAIKRPCSSLIGCKQRSRIFFCNFKPQLEPSKVKKWHKLCYGVLASALDRAREGKQGPLSNRQLTVHEDQRAAGARNSSSVKFG